VFVMLLQCVRLHGQPLPAPPLLLFWNADAQNNANVASKQSIEALQNDASYAYIDMNNLIVSNTSQPDPNAVELVFYVNTATNHTITTASTQGEAWAMEHGFARVRSEGWVYPSNESSGAGFLFEMWYSSDRDDLFLVGTAQNRANAIAANYVKLWHDCFVPYVWVQWPNSPPASIPFPRSTDIADFEFAFGQNAVPPGISADTWYPSWASDGNLYSPWTDGTVNGIQSFSGTTVAHNATTGYATITGDDPFNLTISSVGIFTEPAQPYEGRYPCGSVVVNGIWFYGTYALLNYQSGVNPPPDCGNWCVQVIMQPKVTCTIPADMRSSLRHALRASVPADG
jgi:hypothetical protein